MNTRISNFFTNIPNQCARGAHQAKALSQTTANWAKDHLTSTFRWATNSDFGNSLYTHYIEPLDVTDGVTLGACAAVGCIVMFTAIAILGKPFIAMACIAGISFLFLNGFITKKRLETKTNLEMAQIYNNLVEIVRAGDLENPALQAIATERAELVKVEKARVSEHLNDEKKTFGTEFTLYQNAVLNNRPESFLEIKAGFVTYLEETRNRLDPRFGVGVEIRENLV